MIRTEVAGDSEVADLCELILAAARERLDVPEGEAFGPDDLKRAGLLNGETGLMPEPQCPGREALEASLLREYLERFF